MIINLPTAARVIPVGQLNGFGGCWLVLFAAGVYLAPLPSIISVFKIEEGIGESLGTRFPLVFDGAFALVVSLLVIQLTLAIFMAEKSRGFPYLFIWTGIYIFAMTPLDLIWTGAVVSLPTGQSFGEVIAKVTSAEVIGGWIGATVIVGVWMLYVTRSRRVANTFVQ